MSEWIHLFYQERCENSDKVYRVCIDEEGGEFLVKTEWGRRGSRFQHDVKYRGTSGVDARKVMNRVLREKVGKGYVLLVDAIARGYLSEAEVLGYQL